MFTAIYASILNEYGDPRRLVELAQEAEAAGYDGFFIWDHLALDPLGMVDVADSTVALAAIAQATSKLIIGPMVMPLARRRPWKVAKEIASLDRLSGGRAVYGFGLGFPADVEFAAFGEDASPKGCAERLDEGLEILDRLLTEESVNHTGTHYQVKNTTFAPRGLQSPRPPIWIGASLPATAGLRRGARWDGSFPVKLPVFSEDEPATRHDWWLSPEEFRGAADSIKELRGSLSDFALVATGSTEHDDEEKAAAKLADYAAAGATWWLEWIDEAPDSFETTREFVRRGPVKTTDVRPVS